METVEFTDEVDFIVFDSLFFLSSATPTAQAQAVDAQARNTTPRKVIVCVFYCYTLV